MSFASPLRRRLFAHISVPQLHVPRPASFSPLSYLTRNMATSAKANPPREILPTNVIPRHYKLSLTPDFSTFKFSGSVKVDLEVAESTKSIVLNAVDLQLHSATVTSAGKELKSTKIEVDEEKQTATLEFENELKVATNATTLDIQFTGELNDKMAGFYRSSYIDKKTGEKKWLATTQMGIRSRAIAN